MWGFYWTKTCEKPFKQVTEKVANLLELACTDLADSTSLETNGGKRYYISFIDDSKFTYLQLLRNKNEAEDMLVKYKAVVENQLNRKIRRVGSGKGGEYGNYLLLCEWYVSFWYWHQRD